MQDLNALHVFVALFDTRSTQKAAKKLGRSQSYVSKTLAQLREELTDPLFIRSRNGLIPTSYASSIEAKLRSALEQVSISLEPENFDPRNIDCICIHIIEPYIIHIGKKLIDRIRQESNAIIIIRQWDKNSEQLILGEEVDIGLHVLSDKSQDFYQKKLHSSAGYLRGNAEGEYVKFIVAGVNEYTNFYQKLLPEVEAKIIIDHHGLMEQLMTDYRTLSYHPTRKPDPAYKLNIEAALITKSTRRYSNKIRWISELISELVNNFVDDQHRPGPPMG
ncbi:LysR family transcriptional regulator [Vibrio agarivorans]|uniref:LysR family transcriptional regulator n=1 Tax=Vibrio agarivorans TaxID=153622 RepID=A0ABT7Y438_9VIBR|nr:LysR family transcriptional regulator [Vibrio agarivorans]MDN2482539.1 LysR family transcriptional regulator [Vibrio agarivorans]